MIDQDVALPLIEPPSEGVRSIALAVQKILEAQRDADWKRMEPLVEALELLAAQGNYKGNMYSVPVQVWAVAQAALAQWGKGAKP